VRLEAKVHLVTGAVSAAQNVVKCVQRCGLTVDDMVLEQLASSVAVLTKHEIELGVCLVDMGGGTTDTAVFCRGAIHIKIKYACALSQLANSAR
jgi:cell division protein FtsA